MRWKTQENSSEEAFLHATLSEFVKCWGSGKRARILVESMNGGAFVNFSTLLSNPGMDHTYRRKKAAKANRHPEGHHDFQHSGSAPPSSRKKSKRKTERDNKRAAEFQRKKREEAEREASAAAAKERPSEEEDAKTTKDGDENSANDNIAETANDARLVLHVTDKTLGEDIHSRR